MRKETVNAAFFFLVLLALVILAFVIVLPILDFILLGFLLAIGFWPVRQGIHRVVRSEGWAAFLTLLVAAVLVILPLVLVALALLDDVRRFAAHLEPDDLEGSLLAALGLGGGMAASIAELVVPRVVAFFESFMEDLAESVARMAIGLMVLAFVMFYAFAQGPAIVARVRDMLPLKSVYKDRLVAETESAVHAMFFGQILVAVMHGVVLGLGFWVFGLPNPIVWAFVAVIISILPAIGTPAVWLPAGVYLYVAEGAVPGVGMMLWGAIFSTVFVEYWMRLRLIRRMGAIHPLAVIVGIIGGMAVFGLSGFLFGPLILALLLVFTRVFAATYREDPNYLFL